jgi:hypothetical protein
MQCEYRRRAFSRSNIFNPFKETHTHDGTDQCWMEGNDVADFASPEDKKYYCLFHTHHALKELTKAKWDETSLGKKQSTRLKEPP